jgi:amino acid transporter
VATWPTPLAWYALDEVVRPQHWGLFFNTMLFNYTGWDSLGSLAGEVTNGKRAFPIGVLGALALITINYALPVFLGTLVYPNLGMFLLVDSLTHARCIVRHFVHITTFPRTPAHV